MKKPGSFVLVSTVSLFLAGVAASAAPPQPASVIAGGSSHFAPFGTNKVHYVALGKGSDTILFVHGWACNANFWREQVPTLSEKAQLILIDLPGHGQSDKPQADYSMDFFASAVVAVLDDAKVEKATLVGHSMGAPVICRVYAQAPEKVAALVALDGILRRPKMEPSQAESFIAPYRTPEYRDQATRFIKAMFPNPGTENLRDWVLEQMLATPQHVMSSAMEGMFNQTKPAWDLAKVTVPVLVINAKSPMWTTQYEAYVHSLSAKTEYQTIEGTGHFVMLEKPAEFNAALMEMLKKHRLLK